MANVLDTATYFLQLASAETEQKHLTPLRLQKLLYYAQGWSLALRSRPLFQDAKIQAWIDGPVVPKVHATFAEHRDGKGAISDKEFRHEYILTDDEREFIETIWNAYKKYSDITLRAMSHSEPPWREARGNLAPTEESTNEITYEALEKFFKSHPDFTKYQLQIS